MVKHFQDDPDPPPFIKALAELRQLATREGYCYQHVQSHHGRHRPVCREGAGQPRILPEQAAEHRWGPERRRALAVPDWRSHPLGSACYPKTNQPATASRGTIATATSSAGAGSFQSYRWVSHRSWSIKPATCFSFLCPDQTQVSGGEAKQSSTSDCIGRKRNAP